MRVKACCVAWTCGVRVQRGVRGGCRPTDTSDMPRLLVALLAALAHTHFGELIFFQQASNYFIAPLYCGTQGIPNHWAGGVNT